MSWLESALLVALLGGVGSVLRYLFSIWNGLIPWGILAANSIASFVAGLAIASGFFETALVVGLAGGLSTFSTFAAQTSYLLTKGKNQTAALNTALNLLIPALLFLTASILL